VRIGLGLLALAGAVPRLAPAQPVLSFRVGQTVMIHEHAPRAPYEQLVARGLVDAYQVSVDEWDPWWAGRRTNVFLRFADLVGNDPQQIPPFAHVIAAKLRLVTTNPGHGASLHRMLTAWGAESTWDSFGGDGIQADDREAVAAADLTTGLVRRGAHEFDVTESVQAWVDGQENWGWVFLPRGWDGWDFWTFDAPDADVRPQLTVLYASAVPTLSIAAGDATQTSAVLWAQTATPGPVVFRYATASTVEPPLATFSVDVGDTNVPAKVELDDLVAGTTYYYSVENATGEVRVGQFATPAAVAERRGLRFGVSGDWRGELAPYPAIANVAARQLDFFVALGDTIYADFPSPAVPKPQCQSLDDFRRKHAEVYAPRFGWATWAPVRSGMVWYAGIDDHEVTNDFAGGAPPNSDPRFDDTGSLINETTLFGHGLAAFHEFNPMRAKRYGQTDDPRTAGKAKLYRYRTFGSDAAIFLLDARSFRDEEIGSALDLTVALQPDRFVRSAYTPGRTLLGAAQLADFESDLLAAQAAGVTWKFVLVPEPIQNLGPLLGADRFEGYAGERTELLRFIEDSGIANVVFVAADIHATVVNNVEYQLGPDAPSRPTSTWEVTTGAVAFAAPFGPTVADVATAIPVLGPLFGALYERLDRRGRDELLVDVMNYLLLRWGYDPIGLNGSPIPARLLAGAWVSLHTYGWTEFEIDAVTQQLVVTTYGIDWYDEPELLGDPLGVLTRVPEVVSQFVVDAAGPAR